MYEGRTAAGPGFNVAVLRKERRLSQVKLAHAAGISVSLLKKIEAGERTLTQGVAAAIARGMGVTLDDVLGRADITVIDEASLRELRSVVRRFGLPGEVPRDRGALGGRVLNLAKLRRDADLAGVLQRLPGVLSDVTNNAHAENSPGAWAMVADVYSTVYWIAARHRWMDLADLAVLKQKMAAEQSDPLIKAVATRDEAGTFLNSGDFAGGLAVVDQAIVRAESTMAGRDGALARGLLHLRGFTLAGRHGDRAEADRHIAAAWRIAEDFPEDVDINGMQFGPENTATHVVATLVDLGRHRKALDVAGQFERRESILPATRIAPLRMNVSRAKLAVRDRDGALTSLVDAWDIAPQMAKVHPTSQELLRVLVSLHRRSNPVLTKLARQAGVFF